MNAGGQELSPTLNPLLFTVSITGLNALTEFDVYCMSTSPLGTQLSMAKVYAAATVAATLCCKQLRATIASSTVNEGVAVTRLLSLSLGSFPLSHLFTRCLQMT